MLNIRKKQGKTDKLKTINRFIKFKGKNIFAKLKIIIRVTGRELKKFGDKTRYQ